VDGAPVSPGRHESESKSRRRRKSVVTRGPHVAPTRKDERWRPRHADHSPRAT
jgi:hypothetical protein